MKMKPKLARVNTSGPRRRPISHAAKWLECRRARAPRHRIGRTIVSRLKIF